jgi:PleD family two-component response regulator
MSGFEILEKLKSIERTRNIHVIMLSNLSHQDDMDRAYKLGAEAFLVKSNTSPAEITTTIEKILTA